ncbi:hypothetical protein RCO48_15245 [Peribacillus frigoritolerans]|nr:hypothetical protein [Peribacillus frigoritolerans]
MKNKKNIWACFSSQSSLFSAVFIQLNMGVNSRAEKGKDADADNHERIEKIAEKK